MDPKSDEAADQFLEILPFERSFTPRHCHYCFKDFENDSDLEIHQKEMHIDGEQKYTCHRCNNGKLYPSYENLKLHQRVHVLRYKCKECGYRSFDMRNAKSHIFTTHLKIACFICKICGKDFACSRSLTEHMRVHNVGKNPKKCDEKRKGFEVNKDFLTKANLETSKQSYAVVKPCKCELCGKCFTSNFSLSIHKRDVHSKVSFNCGSCGKTYGCRRYFRRHTKICHKK